MGTKSTLIVCIVAAALTAWSAKADAESKAISLVVSSTGDFHLERAANDPIWLVPAKSEGSRFALPAVQVEVNDEESQRTKTVSSDTLESEPTCFISPDERWIFVQVDTGNNCSSGILYRRAENATAVSDSPHYDLAIPDGFEKSAWRFVSKELKFAENEIGIPDQYGNRVKAIVFAAWSTDSARLLIALSGTAGKPKEPESGGPAEYASSVNDWLCYFNTRTGVFELTERLRKANQKQAEQTDTRPAEPGAVLSAESAGQESLEISAPNRFKKADIELNSVYGKLLGSLSSAQKIELQKEERAWLVDRDIFAAIHSAQSWSPFRNASRVEGLAIATEKRVTELRKRTESKGSE